MAATGLLEEVQAAATAVAEQAGSAVVGIGRGWGLGSGVVVGEGLVLTNAHNVQSEAPDVTFADGRTATGHLAGVDVDGDVAVIRVDTAGAPPVPWEPTQASPALGTVVFGLANPGGRGLRVTLGLVSAVGRAFRGPPRRRGGGTL